MDSGGDDVRDGNWNIFYNSDHCSLRILSGGSDPVKMDAVCMADPFRRAHIVGMNVWNEIVAEKRCCQQAADTEKRTVKNLVITRKNTCNQKYSMLY